jgi:flavin reductase (DIM6/NTAB) family NADH-FMN oxidoreductase RutF
MREFTDSMAELASGVVLVTCQVAGRTWGTTATSFTSVSTDPPTVLVVLTADSRAARAIGATGRFGVLVLAADHVDVARASATPGAPKFLGVVEHALARVDCDVAERLEVADHVVFFGRVRAAHAARDEREPLLYHRRRYTCLSS